MAKTADNVLSFIKSRPATIPDGFTDDDIEPYVAEALPALLAYCTVLPRDATAVPDVLIFAWAEIATALMWRNQALPDGQVSTIKEGDISVSFTKGKIDGSKIVYAGLDSIGTMNRFRTLF